MSLRQSVRIFTLIVLVDPTILRKRKRSPRMPFGNVWMRQRRRLLNFSGGQLFPGCFAAFAVNQERIDGILRTAPRESTQASGTILSIPFPDGSYKQFRVEASPVIEKPLESPGFETITYKEGRNRRSGSATIRFEQAFDGFHAMVRSSSGVFYIDPYTKTANRGKEGPYLSYFYTALVPSPVRKLHYEVSGDRAKQNRRPAGNRLAGRAAAPPTSFAPKEVRTYRIALAVNSYYVAAVYDPSVSSFAL